ncbi:MAG: hypothetical protein VX430_02770 [Pseudomonadota bacterium]|nr:hypothetical protein [Pseudomonadota bacterium]
MPANNLGGELDGLVDDFGDTEVKAVEELSLARVDPAFVPATPLDAVELLFVGPLVVSMLVTGPEVGSRILEPVFVLVDGCRVAVAEIILPWVSVDVTVGWLLLAGKPVFRSCADSGNTKTCGRVPPFCI